MDSVEHANNELRKLIIQILVVLSVAVLMIVAIFMVYKNEPNLNEQTMRLIARNFEDGVTNAHWQWIVEGEPNRIVLIQYDTAGKETGRSPLPMSHRGWPRADESDTGCENVWRGVLGMPLQINNFKVNAIYIDGEQQHRDVLSSTCRYQLSTGPYFEYFIYTGQVNKDNL